MLCLTRPVRVHFSGIVWLVNTVVAYEVLVFQALFGLVCSVVIQALFGPVYSVVIQALCGLVYSGNSSFVWAGIQCDNTGFV